VNIRNKYLFGHFAALCNVINYSYKPLFSSSMAFLSACYTRIGL
jgi:hypothetical protein